MGAHVHAYECSEEPLWINKTENSWYTSDIFRSIPRENGWKISRLSAGLTKNVLQSVSRFRYYFSITTFVFYFFFFFLTTIYAQNCMKFFFFFFCVRVNLFYEILLMNWLTKRSPAKKTNWDLNGFSVPRGEGTL